jgi:3-oxoacyl-[acyl-carrier protein] reductase
MGALEGQVALVTGSSRGIGRATAERLARDGAALAVNYATNAAAANDVVETIRNAGGKATAIQADIGKLDDIRRLVRETMARFGRIDILIANAGYSAFNPLLDTTEDEFDRTYAINAKGTFFCMQEALRHMADGGRIVCVSTIGTVMNMPGGACYFGSKAAIEQFCRVAAREVASRGITVNVISPGFVDTEMLQGVLASGDPAIPDQLVNMTPLARFGSPNDIAAMVAFLVGPDSRWITRQNFPVDGGIVSR